VEISFHGANCVSLIAKSASLLVDPIVPGLKIDTKKADIILATANQSVVASADQLIINTPGEYEAKGVSIKGIAARAHVEEEGGQGTTMYRVDMNNIRVAIVGHIFPDLNDEQLEALGTIDVLVVPVGGNGYTLDAAGAAQVVRAVEPKVVIPTHFADTAVKYEVPQAELKLFTDEIGGQAQEEVKLKLKAGDYPEQMTIITLNRTS
jgi:L-ascorbate metabolism protein UlaG (beta-lactamase superfamily)